MKYSVIIPAYNEEASIAHCLEALTKQTIAEPFEVIVVDNRSTDATSAIARKFATKLNLRVLYEKKQGRGAARATGFAAAKGDFLFSTDADAMVPPEWMESFVEFFTEHPDAAAVTSTATIDSCTPMQNAMFNALLSTALIATGSFLVIRGSLALVSPSPNKRTKPQEDFRRMMMPTRILFLHPK
jgi:glycosyltransferase involved in cell wall biosynthesis